MLIMGILLLAAGSSTLWFAYQLRQPENGPITAATLNITVTRTGLHALSPADVQTLSGLALSDWSSQPVALTEQGKPVPTLIDNGRLIFFGRVQPAVYSHERVYQLHLGAAATGKSQPFKQFPAAPNSAIAPHSTTVERLAHFEQDNRYVSIARTDESADTWYWERIHISEAFELTADLPHPADGSATLTAHLFGVSYDDSSSANDHDLDLIINGRTVDQLTWDGNRHFYPQLTLPAGSLKTGANHVLLDNRPEGNSPIDISELDWLTFTYPADPSATDDYIHFKTAAATLELSGFSAPPLILAFFADGSVALAEGATFSQGRTMLTVPQAAEIYATAPHGWLRPEKIELLPPSHLKTASTQTDLIIISDAELAPELAPLIAARQAQGLTVTLATVEEIYNRFGYGQPSPQAIQAYLADALTRWPKPAPRYLFLVGGTTYDYRKNLASERQSRVPSLLIGAEYSGETVSDARLADVDGDGRTDFAVGRWPVYTPAQTAALVRRTLAYERAQPAAQLLFAADGSAPPFAHTADRLATSGQLHRLEPVKVYGGPADTLADQWNSGNWLVTYVGHGSIDLWGSEALLSSERVAELHTPPETAPPIVLQFTCLTGFFAHPTQPSLSETLLLSEDGAVLIVSATSLTYSSSQEPFAAGLLSRLADPSVVRMGDVVSQAREALNVASPDVKEVYDTFVLLGDPSAVVGRPEAILTANTTQDEGR